MYVGIKSEKNTITNRQLQVLKLVAQGYTNDEIAEDLVITKHTVKAHISSIYEALNVSSRVQITIKALKLGLIQLDEL